jgi:hypothetical protein
MAMHARVCVCVCVCAHTHTHTHTATHTQQRAHAQSRHSWLGARYGRRMLERGGVPVRRLDLFDFRKEDIIVLARCIKGLNVGRGRGRGRCVCVRVTGGSALPRWCGTNRAGSARVGAQARTRAATARIGLPAARQSRCDLRQMGLSPPNPRCRERPRR